MRSSALTTATRPTAPWLAGPITHSRPLSLFNFNKKGKKGKSDDVQPDYSNPLLMNYLKEQEEAKGKDQKKTVAGPKPILLKISPKTSIYTKAAELRGYREGLSTEEQEEMEKRNAEAKERLEKDRQMRAAASVIDPDPRGRIMWERDMVIKSIQHRGRLSKDDKIAKTERESLFKSIDLATTPKKMTKLMRQIQGKTLEEALIQMRFSKKRIARDIVKGLQLARYQAIVGRGMGLGSIAGKPVVEEEPQQDENESDEAFEGRKLVHERELKLAEERALSPGTFRKEKTGPAQTIELKDGRKIDVHDPTDMYIDQAWMGKGEMQKSVEPRARGMTNILRHRTASKSLSWLSISLCVRIRAAANLMARLYRCVEGREDADAHFGGDQEEARQSQALDGVAGSTYYRTEAVLLVVGLGLGL